MPFLLEIPDVYGNVNLTSFRPGVPLKPVDRLRNYCWVLEGTLLEDKRIAIRGPEEAQAFDFSPVYWNGYFEVMGPVRVISFKAYVQLYEAYRRQRELVPFRWHPSVYKNIQDLDEDDAQKKR